MKSGRAALFLCALGALSFLPPRLVEAAESPTNSSNTGAELLKTNFNSLPVRSTGSNTLQIGVVEIDKSARTVAVPAKVRITKDVVEYALVTETGKAYESLLTTEARPTDIHLAFLLLGVGPAQLTGDFQQPATVPDTNAVRIEVSWQTNGQPVTGALADLILLKSGSPGASAAPLKLVQWLYNGSVLTPGGFAAQREGSIISLIRDPAALLNNPGPDRDNDEIHFPNPSLLPPQGAAVRVTFRLPAAHRPIQK